MDSLILIKAPGSGHHEDLSDNEVEHPRLQSSGRLENPVTLTDDKLKLREPLSSGVGSKDFIDKVVDNDQEDTEDYEEIPHEMLVSENDIERARKQFFGSEYEQVMRTREEKGVIYESVYIQNPEPPKSMKLLTRAGSSSCPSKISNITFGLSNKGSSRYTKDIVYIELVHQNEKEKADREAAVELQEKYLAEAVEKARADHAEKSAEAERLRAALARLG